MHLTDSFVVGETVIEVALADIVSAEVEVIVNSVCDRLHFGTGVSGAIYKIAGPEVYHEAYQDVQSRGLRAGDAAVSGGGGAPFRLIFHAISSRCESGTTPEILKKCVAAVLDAARQNGVRSIAFPALGTGQMGFSVKEAARILIEMTIRDCSENMGIEKVVFCLLRPDAFTAFFREAVKHSVRQEYIRTRESTGLAETGQQPKNAGENTELIRKLQECPAGKDGWMDFESIAAGLFSTLFVPPLSEPRFQARTESGLNIRDAAFPNYAETGFWSVLDRRYQARIVVLECKNYTKPIGQNAVNQVSRYLRGKALGKVGFIASRIEPSAEARKAQKEVFRDLDQVILLLEDFDFSQMINLKRLTGSADQYLQRIIDDFSLAV